MRSTIISLSTLLTLTTAQTTSLIGAVIPLGADCVPGGTPCALGAQCYATNSMLQPRCGNFQAACTSDQQCAVNTCNLAQGLCNGVLSSSVASVSASITIAPSSTSASAGFSGAPSPTVSAPAGSLPLGAECNPFVQPSQCSGGAQCWASNAGLIARCGNFNAACTSNSQCAVNTCNNGLCNGLLPSSSAGGNGTLSMSTMTPSRTASRSGSASATSSGFTQFTGAAAVKDVAGGVVVVALGGLACLL